MGNEITIRKYALQNAVKFNGKANIGAVVGKVLGESPELKKDMGKLSREIKKIVEEVNSLKPEQQEKELEKYADLIKEHVKEERDIFSVFEIKKGEKITTAFPPEPSKYPHIGHAKSILLNYELAKKYNGKFILRFEDTNPKLAETEFYKIHLENYRWLGVNPDLVDYVSDYVPKFYELAKDMIKKGFAYMCTCAQEETKKNRLEGKECACRNLASSENMKKFEEMFESKEGDMVLRLKGDMQNENTTMRDPTLLRIIDHAHARQKKKYRIWPTYDFENAVMDGIEGVTHRLRTKEFELRNALQGYMQNMLGFKQTNIYEFARFNMEGVESSGRIIREKVNNGELIGWDDPSLTTLVALKRRGFASEAIKNFVLNTGITKSESTLTWDDLIVHNKKILDAKTGRYFFIHDAMEIKVENAPKQEVALKMHPDSEERKRKFKVHDTFLIEKQDFDGLKEGKIHRLMDCLNFVKKGGNIIFDSLEHEDFKKNPGVIIHWLPKGRDLVNAEVLMPDKKLVKGVAEPLILKLKEDDVIQFARFGFCRLDKKDKTKLHFWYTHK